LNFVVTVSPTTTAKSVMTETQQLAMAATLGASRHDAQTGLSLPGSSATTETPTTAMDAPRPA